MPEGEQESGVDEIGLEQMYVLGKVCNHFLEVFSVLFGLDLLLGHHPRVDHQRVVVNFFLLRLLLGRKAPLEQHLLRGVEFFQQSHQFLFGLEFKLCYVVEVLLVVCWFENLADVLGETLWHLHSQ